MKKILITGGTSYIGKHCIAQLLKKKYQVRTTVRDLSKTHTISLDIENYLQSKIELEFIKADLTNDNGWKEAVKGCDAILHVASPFPRNFKGEKSDLIIPARDGTKRVLRAARDNEVYRLIITSSNAAISGGQPNIFTFNENNWTNLESENLSAYSISKTLAEKEVWNFANRYKEMKLTTINPALVLGPGIGEQSNSASIQIFKMLLNREIPFIPDIYISIVDVRDVAKMHISALENINSIGKRFLLCENVYRIKKLSLKLIELGYQAPTLVVPSFFVKLASLFDNRINEIMPLLGKSYEINSNLAKEQLGFKPIPMCDTLKDMAAYLRYYLK